MPHTNAAVFMSTFQVPRKCQAGYGQSLHPDRHGPCKICYLDIALDEHSITHVQEPCYTAFHAECLTSWLPYAGHVEDDDTGLFSSFKQPSCPNCRGSLGETNIPQYDDDDAEDDDETEINVDDRPLGLTPYAWPVSSLDQIRDTVGDYIFTDVPLAEARYDRPVRFDEIVISQDEPTPPVVINDTRQADVLADLVQEEGNFIPSDPSIDILYLFPDEQRRTPLQTRRQTPQHPYGTTAGRPNPPPPSIVTDMIQTNLNSHGVTHYEAFSFSVHPHGLTTFYLPLSTFIEPLPSITALRTRISNARQFHDPTFTGRWLRSPTVYTPYEVDRFLANQPDAATTVIPSMNEDVSMEGWAMYLPSSISQRGLIYAVPVVSFTNTHSISSLSEIEEGEIVTGLLQADGNVDTTAYWAPERSPADQMRTYGAEIDRWRRLEIELAAYDRVFEMECSGQLETPQLVRDGGRHERWMQEILDDVFHRELETPRSAPFTPFSPPTNTPLSPTTVTMADALVNFSRQAARFQALLDRGPEG